MMEISCEFHYDSAHYLPNVARGHKCGRMHGHTYTLTVVVAGEPDPETGWIIDFAEIKSAFGPLVAQLDHHLINEVIENPTVENQLIWFWKQAPIPVAELRLSEGLSNAASYRG